MNSHARNLMASVLLLAALNVARSQPPARRARQTAPDITSEDLRARLSIFADDSMLGRLPGTIGEQRATRYLEGEARRLGLRPAGEKGSYFQTVPLVDRTPGSASFLTTASHQRLNLCSEFVPVPNPGAPAGPSRVELANVGVVFGGRASDTSTWISADRARGKIVILSSTRFVRPLSQRFASAAVLAIEGLDEAPPPVLARLHSARTLLRGDAEGANHQRILVSHSAARRLMNAAADAAIQDLPPGAPGTTIGGVIQYDDRHKTGRNVVAVLPGSDPLLRKQYVALTAHHDHLGFNHEPVDSDSLHVFRMLLERAVPGASDGASVSSSQQASTVVNVDSLRQLRPSRLDSIYNGANDDGSGSVALLEIAESLVRRHASPRRSVLFVWHTAEELGLLGSWWFSEHPTVARNAIVADLNIDSFGRYQASDYRAGMGPRHHIIGSRRLAPALGDIVEEVNRALAHPLQLDFSLDTPGHPSQAYCRSDHVNYARHGIPSVFITDPINPDYHAVTDEAQYIDYEGFVDATRFANALVLHLARMSRVPTADAARRVNPRAQCLP